MTSRARHHSETWDARLASQLDGTISLVDEADEFQPWPGVTFLKWDSLRIPQGGIVITLDDNGQPDITITTTTRINAWMHWLDISLQHLKAAHTAREEAIFARRAGELEKLYDAVVREYQSALQCVCAAAYAAEAFWYALLDHKIVPEMSRSTPGLCHRGNSWFV